MILYADVLFVIDFSMDVISLWITAQLTSVRLSTLRASAAAAVSSLASVIVTALGASRAISVSFTVVLSLVMCLIAFKRLSLALLIKRFIILWLAGVLLGGVMTYLMSIGLTEKSSFDLDRYGGVIGVIPAALFLIFILVRTLCTSKSVKSAELTVSHGDKRLCLTALCDSGNLLVDPFTGESVVFLRADKARDLFDDTEYAYLISESTIIPESLIRTIRIVPATTVSGSSLVRAIRASVIVNGKNDCLALVALTQSLDNDDFDAVISPKLM